MNFEQSTCLLLLFEDEEKLMYAWGRNRILIEPGKASRSSVDDNDVWVHTVLTKFFLLFIYVILIWFASSCGFMFLFRNL